MTKEERKDYHKAYYKEHKDEISAYKKAYYQSHKEEYKARQNAYYKEHKEESKVYRQEHIDDYAVYQKVYLKAYRKTDTNSIGVTKNTIRGRSNRYLFTILKHTKLKGYEIHHCFGYEDFKSFIYIPKELHLQIHQFLRDNGISAESNHYQQIAHLINEWDGYTYIKV